MKIEKKIVKNSAKLSLAAKSAIAASFGIAAVALTACEESGSVAAPERPDLENPDTGAPKTETPSSSNAVDIPLSHEALSSSAVEALSSAAEPDFPPQAGVIPPDDIYPEPSSSSEAKPLSSSSSDEPYPPPEAGVIEAPDESDFESSSSSEVNAQSSSAEEPVLQIFHLTEGVIGAEMISMHKRCEFKHFENLLRHAAYAVVAVLFILRGSPLRTIMSIGGFCEQ